MFVAAEQGQKTCNDVVTVEGQQTADAHNKDSLSSYLAKCYNSFPIYITVIVTMSVMEVFSYIKSSNTTV